MIRRVKQTTTIVMIIALFALSIGGCSVRQESPNIPVPAVVPSPTAKGADVNQYIIDAVLDTSNKELTAE